MSDKTLSAAERMEAFHRQMTIDKSGLNAYLNSLPFSPDPFQIEAVESVAMGESVLVCAPTGSGKTVVGEATAALALKRGERVFYTTPIKALSNQKFRDLQQQFGEDKIGLLTGDTSINGDAPIVVMTTEVLRNMIYAGADLSQLGGVVLDEVHYLSDKFRGPVWEEVMIQLPTSVQIVALSATVSNSLEFADWIRSVRGSCKVVVSTNRPVPLYQHMMVGSDLYDLYAQPNRAAKSKIPEVEKLNPDLLAAIAETTIRRGRSYVRKAPWVSRIRVVESLDRANLLPAIFFIFSRAACDDAASEVAGAYLDLTSYEEKQRIRARTDAALDLIPVEDHGALGLVSWARDLESGVAAHHAGLLPVLKEAVEDLFSQGLLKVVFATETLALGINMPARTVVLESLEKWDGSEHVRLGPREYTQLTGRAGRRGIDVEGHAVVLDRRQVTPEEVASLASRRSYPLKSAFHPTYNMAVNLLSRTDVETTRQILESSFAQYQADASVVELAQKLRKAQRKVDQAKAELHCEFGDAAEYFQMREDVSQMQKMASTLGKQNRQKSDWDSVTRLRLGDVVSYQKGRRRSVGVVVQPSSSGFGVPLARIVDEDGKLGKVGPKEATDGIERIGRIHVPKQGFRKPRERNQLARDLRDLQLKPSVRQVKRNRDPKVEGILAKAQELESQLRLHPVHSCPDRELHASVGHRYARLGREKNQLAQKIAGRTARIVAEFDQVCQVLRSLGFLDGDRVTKRGSMLRRVYGERDLVIAEAISGGIWAELDPAEFAAIISTVVFEPRSEMSADSSTPSLPTPRLRVAWSETEQCFRNVNRAESQAGIERTPPPSAEIASITYSWSKGASLAKILERTEMSGGDFVRWMRQVIDMLEQIRRIENSPLRDSAEAARRLVLRNVVAWTEGL